MFCRDSVVTGVEVRFTFPQDFPQSKDSSNSSSRSSPRFAPFGSQTDQSAYWEQRAAQIQQAAQMKARRAVRSNYLLLSPLRGAAHGQNTRTGDRPRCALCHTVGCCVMRAYQRDAIAMVA